MMLTIIAIVLLLLAIFYLYAGLRSLKRLEPVTSVAHVTISVAFFAVSAALVLGFITLKGYRAFTYEALAATIHIQPVEDDVFDAHVQYPDGDKKTYRIHGQELYVDAHILKWKPIANFVGMHTSYQLSRLGGRYQTVLDELNKKRSVYMVGEESSQDLFNLSKKFSSLTFLVDAEYGSASFIPAREAHYALMVSTSGLLFREITAP